MDLSLIARGATPINLDRPRLLFYNASASWLLYKRYGWNFIAALCRTVGKGESAGLEIVSEEALVFFLYAGLLVDAQANGEQLTEQAVADLITPFNMRDVFLAVATTVAVNNRAPVVAGKAEAAPAGPAAAATQPGPRKGSTSKKRSVSRTASSISRRSSSSRKRSRK